MAVEAGRFPQPQQDNTSPGISAPGGSTLGEARSIGLPVVAKNIDGNVRPLSGLPTNVPSAEPRATGLPTIGRDSDRRASRTATVATAAVLAVSQADCSVDAQSDRQPDASTTVTSAQIAPTVEIPPAIAVGTVLPDELPQAVAAQAGAVVDIGYRKALEEARLPDGTLAFTRQYEGSTGSGVRISETEIATVGHVTAENPDINCGDFTVTGQDVDGERVYQSGVTGEAGSYLSKYDSADAYDVPDFAIMTVDPQRIEGLGLAQIREEPLQVGEPVFFINYQPVEEGGADRAPLEQAPYSEPAIYGGIVADTDGQLVNVITDLQSYGEIPDDTSRGGASGGPLFDREGSLVGVASQAEEGGLLDPSLAFGVNLEGYPGQTVSLTKVQPITEDLLRNTREDLLASPSCPRTEPEITILE